VTISACEPWSDISVDSQDISEAADALLVLGLGCPHCASVLEGLCGLVKTGVLGRLEVVNAVMHPERARELGVHSVPWTRIGPFELPGARAPRELREWAERVGTETGNRAYLTELLASGQLAVAQRFIGALPGALAVAIDLSAHPETPLKVRLGVGALLEEIQGSDLLATELHRLGALSESPDPRVRADACHHLSLTGSLAACPYLERRLSDQDRDVREIAAESLARFGSSSRG
jgi:hypothetical protein